MYKQTVGSLAIYINKYLQTKNKVIKTYEAMYVDTDRNKFAASPNSMSYCKATRSSRCRI
jgi:hypothetical protein